MTDEIGKVVPITVKDGFIRQFFTPLVRADLALPTAEDEYWPSLWVCGGAMLIRRDALTAVYSSAGRYLNSDLFLYGDEIEFCFLASKAGYRAVLAKQAIVYHKPAQSTGGRYNPIAYYYMERNRLLLAKELLPMRWKALFHPVNAFLCLARAVKNVVYWRLNSGRAILCGLWDGYRGITGKWKHHDREVSRYDAG